MIRVIFEFETEDDAQAFIVNVEHNINLGNLTITRTWSWGSEVFEPIALLENENDED